jgi:hypothetical protein
MIKYRFGHLQMSSKVTNNYVKKFAFYTKKFRTLGTFKQGNAQIC